MKFRVFLLLLALVSGWGVAAPDDFSEAKRLAQRIYSDETETFYCGCPLRWQGGKGIPDLKSCGYQVRKNGPRAQRIEWEHVVPAHQFGKDLACWKQGGREQCGRSDARFGQMEANLFNLKPAIGEVNGDRANFAFGLLPQMPLQHGACPFRVDFKRQLAEPRAEVRGDIARIYFYMADRYQLELAASQQKLLLSWHQQDPVDARELQLQQRIAQQMGHANLFVTGQREWFLGYPSGARFGPRSDALITPVTQVAAASQATASSLRTPTVTKAATTAADKTQVLGNKNSQLYHLAHCPGYQQVSQKNQRWFSSVAAAEQAGYRRAKNCK